MPLTREAADAFGVVTICLVALLILLGLLCAVYTCYFRSRIRSQGFIQLSYFSGPWIIRITFILFVIWWGFGEIIRLSFLRREGQLLNALDLTWQRTACKCYIVSNLGFTEPCFFLTFVFLLRAPLQRIESGILGRKWNAKTVGFVLLYCFPVFVLQLILILIGPQFREGKKLARKLPHYFTSTDISNNASRQEGEGEIALCTYPLFSTILLGLFVTILTIYTIWRGRQILKLVINKGLQKRVYTLIVSVSSLLPLRVVLLGFSVLSKPEHFLFEALSFSAFLTLLCCAGLCICMLVYLPIADSLALGNPQHDLEARRRIFDDQIDTISLMANGSQLETSPRISTGRNSDYSTKRGSVSFRTLAKDGPSSTGTFVELSLFSAGYDDVFQPGSPPLLGSSTPPPSHLLGSCRNN